MSDQDKPGSDTRERPLREIPSVELPQILEDHRFWLEPGPGSVGGTQANFANANLGEAQLADATLADAILTGANGLKQEQLDFACGDAETKLPAGLTIKTCEDNSAPSQR